MSPDAQNFGRELPLGAASLSDSKNGGCAINNLNPRTFFWQDLYFGTEGVLFNIDVHLNVHTTTFTDLVVQIQSVCPIRDHHVVGRLVDIWQGLKLVEELQQF